MCGVSTLQWPSTQITLIERHVRTRDSMLWRHRWQEASEFLCTRTPLFWRELSNQKLCAYMRVCVCMCVHVCEFIHQQVLGVYLVTSVNTLGCRATRKGKATSGSVMPPLILRSLQSWLDIHAHTYAQARTRKHTHTYTRTCMYACIQGGHVSAFVCMERQTNYSGLVSKMHMKRQAKSRK